MRALLEGYEGINRLYSLDVVRTEVLCGDQPLQGATAQLRIGEVGRRVTPRFRPPAVSDQVQQGFFMALGQPSAGLFAELLTAVAIGESQAPGSRLSARRRSAGG